MDGDIMYMKRFGEGEGKAREADSQAQGIWTKRNISIFGAETSQRRHAKHIKQLSRVSLLKNLTTQNQPIKMYPQRENM